MLSRPGSPACCQTRPLTVSAQGLSEGGRVGDVVGRRLFGHQSHRGPIRHLWAEGRETHDSPLGAVVTPPILQGCAGDQAPHTLSLSQGQAHGTPHRPFPTAKGSSELEQRPRPVPEHRKQWTPLRRVSGEGPREEGLTLAEREKPSLWYTSDGPVVGLGRQYM